MIGIGAANIAAGFVQGFAVSTSGSRTAVAEQSGAKSQLTGVVGAGIVVLLLLFLNSLLADLPQSALAAVVIAAALSLMDVSLLRQVPAGASERGRALARGDRAGVIVFGVLQGIVIAIVLSVLLVLPPQLVAARRSARPGRRTSTGWHSVEQHAEPQELQGIVIYRWEAPLFFANAGAFRRQIRHLVRERRPRWVVLQCEAITDIDVTAAEMLEQLDRELNAEGRPRRVRRDAHPLAGPHSPVRAAEDTRP